MAYISSKKYGSSVQHYKKSNGDISFFITFRDEYNKPKRMKIGNKSNGITEPYCFQKRNEIINKIRLGEFTPNQKKATKKFSFQNAYDAYIAYIKNNKKTWEDDKSTYNKHLKNKFGDKNLKSLRAKDFEDFKQELLKKTTSNNKPYKPRTIVLILGLARHIINHAIDNELIKNYSNPIANGKVKMPPINNIKLGYLDKEQASKLLHILKNRKNQLAYKLTVLLLFTGARFSEVASLTWNDINFKEQLIYFKETKRGNSRYIKMTKHVIEVLNDLFKNKTSHLVIPSKNGKQIIQMPKQWQIIVDTLIPGNTKAEKYRITTHSLRHTHASWLALDGTNILDIKEQLGHKKLEMTLRYSHSIDKVRYDKTLAVFNDLI